MQFERSSRKRKFRDGISSTLREILVTWDPQKHLAVNTECYFGGLFKFGEPIYNQNNWGGRVLVLLHLNLPS